MPNHGDLYPNCFSNFVDECGECDGDNSSCSGCLDENAFNFNCLNGRLIENYAKERLQLHQLYAHVAAENQYSIQLFESQNFFLVGKKKDWNFYEGQFHDELIYQKIV